VFGAIGGFTAYAYALKHLPVATVSLYAYVNPLIAVILGTALLDEPLNPRLAIVATLVLVGIWMVKDPEWLMANGLWLTIRFYPNVQPSATSHQPSRASDDAAAADQSNQEQHDGDDQQHIDEVAHRVAADDAEQPQHDQNDRNSF
jgi:hypothetical protein